MSLLGVSRSSFTADPQKTHNKLFLRKTLSQSVNFTKILTFADDTKVVSEIAGTEDTCKLQGDLNKIVKWTAENKMELNAKKFELINHRISGFTSSLKLLEQLPFFNNFSSYNATDTTTISPSLFVKDLGVMVDTKLSWNQQISYVTTSSKKMCGWILSVFYTRDKNVLLPLFNALVRSKLEYCNILWNPYLIKDIVKVEGIQRYFTSKMEGMSDFDYWQRLKLLKIRSLQRRRERAIIIYLWRIKNNVVPNSFEIEFKENKRMGGQKAVVKPLPKVKGKILTTYDESFPIISAKLWNILPSKITKIDFLGSFKVHLDNFLDTIPDNPPLPGYPSNSNNSLLSQFRNVG